MNEPKPYTSVQSGKLLTRKQREAIPHLIGARSLQEGCRKGKLSKVTFYAWLKKDDAFKEALESAREGVINEALERLKMGITGAVDGLLNLTEDKNKGIRLRAIDKAIDFFLRIRELDEVERRLQNIEKTILGRKT